MTEAGSSLWREDGPHEFVSGAAVREWVREAREVGAQVRAADRHVEAYASRAGR